LYTRIPMRNLSFSERFRPTRLDQFLGQERWLEDSGILKRSIERGRPASLLFWGPPGTGKTSLAGVYMNAFSSRQIDLHPSTFQTAEVKKILEEASSSPLLQPPILWIDEIHRLTRPQQDLLLRAVEQGSVSVIAATTENPSFVLSNALLSRLTVLTFTSLSKEHLLSLIDRVIQESPSLSISQEARHLLSQWAAGDARKLLGALEPLAESGGDYDKKELLAMLSGHTGPLQALGEGRYLLISALHKSVRGSDPQAALYWLARLLQAGEDPLYIARRLIRMAVEDIGLADPQALSISLRAQECFKALGPPEGELALAEAAVYLALSPKSASVYVAFDKAKESAQNSSHLLPPSHIVNAPTKWMKEQGYAEGYKWDHDEKDAFSGQEYFPDGVEEREYYEPVERGYERELSRRLNYFRRLREQKV